MQPTFLQKLALWHNGSHALYWLVGLMLLAILILSALCATRTLITRPTPSSTFNKLTSLLSHPAVFCLLIFITSAAFRSPILALPWELNPDESVFLAGAITLKQFPLFWVDVDSTTSGPLVYYPLVVPGLLRFDLNYAAARLVGLVMVSAGLLFIYGTIRRFVDEQLCRLILIPCIAFFSLTLDTDFLHYSSEHCPFLICAAAMYFAALSYHAADKRRNFYALLTGILTVMGPLAKQQSVPIAAGIALAAFVGLICRVDTPRRVRWKSVFFLVTGALLIPCIVVIYSLFVTKLSALWYLYVIASATYVDDAAWNESLRSLAEGLYKFPEFVGRSESFAAFLWPYCLLTIIGILAAFLFLSRVTATVRIALLLSSFIFALSVLSVLWPGRTYRHYLLLLVGPEIVLAALAAQACWLAVRQSSYFINRQATQRKLFAILILLPALASQLIISWKTPNEAIVPRDKFAALGPSPVASTISAISDKHDRMAVYGFAAKYHVETSLIQATRRATSNREIMGDPFFRKRYIDDMKRTKPRFFLDAVGKGSFLFQDRDRFAHEQFPQLNQIISTSYELIDDVSGVRIYVRKDDAADNGK